MAIYSNQSTLYDYIVKDNIPDGNHTLILYNNTSIDVEIYNFLQDIEYSSNPVLGDNIPDTKMLILIYHKDLIIDSGVLLTPQTRKKGMVIYCYGKLTNNGNISMTARGAVATGQDVYLIKNVDGSFEYVPAVGGTGGASASVNGSTTTSGIAGSNGINRSTAGGGSGQASGWRRDGYGISLSGPGGTGTSYSGGAGGGGIRVDTNDTSTWGPLSAGSSSGGAGGNGYAFQGNSSISLSGGGGAGNPGGLGGYANGSAGSNGNGNSASYSGSNGTGGLLIIFSNNFNNYSIIESKGSNGGNATSIGGSSGGGSINIFYIYLNNTGTINADGGTTGGAGGNGCITLSKFPIRFLIKDNDRIKTSDGINLTDIGNENNISLFQNYGMTLDNINSTVIEKISNNKYNMELLK